MRQIWERYFLKELIKVFLLFTASFYFLYVLIDYSAHTKIFHQADIHFFDVVLYYLYQFTKRADILIPIGMLIAVVKVLTTSNLRNEIVALVVGGISLKRLMYPFLLAAGASSCLLYLNFQFLQPLSLDRLHTFEENFFKDRAKETATQRVHSLILQDNSLLLYQSYDQKTRALFDAYWLKSSDQLYRIKTLYPFTPTPLGNYVDILVRSSQGEIERTERHTRFLFPEMKFDNKILFTTTYPPRWQSITQLFQNLRWKHTAFGMGKMSDQEAQIATCFFYKLIIPLTPLLTVLAIAPLCLCFGRSLSVFKIYSLSLFGIITFFTLVNSCIILGESQVVSPFLAVMTPILPAFGVFGWKYIKL